MTNATTYTLETTSTSASATITGLTKGQTYYFKISGTNIIGEGPLSGNFSLLAAQVPS
jgi:hypothetical protein